MAIGPARVISRMRLLTNTDRDLGGDLRGNMGGYVSHVPGNAPAEISKGSDLSLLSKSTHLLSKLLFLV